MRSLGEGMSRYVHVQLQASLPYTAIYLAREICLMSFRDLERHNAQ
jgi:hypothetical protein